MLLKSQRLNLKKDFKWISSGKRFETNFLKITFRFGENLEPRIGITSPSKTFKKAVDRNRARRLASAAFEPLYPTLPKGINILVLPKMGILSVKSGDVLVDLEQNLKDEKIINNFN